MHPSPPLVPPTPPAPGARPSAVQDDPTLITAAPETAANEIGPRDLQEKRVRSGRPSASIITPTAAPSRVLPAGISPPVRAAECQIAKLTTLITVAIAVFGTLTWGSGHGPEPSDSALVPMAPITALLFAGLGLALGIRLHWREAPPARGLMVAATLLALPVAGLTLAQSHSYFPLPWDSWLLAGGAAPGAVPNGRMSPVTAVAFLATAVGMLGQGLRAPHRLARALAVAGAGAGWLIATAVLIEYAAGGPLLYNGQAEPMAFIAALAFLALDSGLLLAGPAGARLHAWRTCVASHEIFPGERRFFLQLSATGLALIVVLAIGGIYQVRRDRAAASAVVLAHLDAVADLKAGQIREWREEQLHDARFLRRSLGNDVEEFINQPGDPAARARAVRRLEQIHESARFESVQLFDLDSRLLLSVPESAADDAQLPPATLADALVRGDAVLGDLHRSARGGSVHLDLAVPVLSQSAAAQTGKPAGPPTAVLLLQLKVTNGLFPMAQRWPTPSDSAEILLVRREKNDVVYLNDLRHLPGTALTLRRPLAEQTLPAAKGLRGEPNVREGRDYRGVEVLTAVRAIPGSQWMLVAKIDRAEVFAPLRRAAWQSGALVSLLLVTVGLGTAFLWRQRHTASLRRALIAERERNALAERLAHVTQQANDIIVLFDHKMRIVDANERAVTAYGRSVGELRRMSAADLRVPAEVPRAGEDFTAALANEGVVFETIHRRKDGSPFPVEVSARRFETRGEQQVMSIVRDITERKRVESELRKKQAALATAQRIGRIGNWELDHPTGALAWSPEIFRIFEIEADKFGASYESFLRVIHPGDRDRVDAVFNRSLTSRTPYEITHRLLLPDGRVKYVQELGETHFDPAGRPLHTVGTVQDITRQVQTHEALRLSVLEKEALLSEVHHRVKNNLQVIMSLLRLGAVRNPHPDVQGAMRDMQARIRSMAQLHESLYRSGNFAEVDMATYLRRLATQLFRANAIGDGRIRLVLELAPVHLAINQAVPCGLLITELMTNAIKHGFPGAQRGELRIELAALEGGELRLRVSDTGIGLPPDFEQKRLRSLGMQLISDLSRQLGGQLEICSDAGARFEVNFSPKRPPPAAPLRTTTPRPENTRGQRRPAAGKSPLPIHLQGPGSDHRRPQPTPAP